MTVRKRLIVAQSDQVAADEWILQHCNLLLVTAPLNRGTILSACCSEAGRMCILMEGTDRGWWADDGYVFFANEGEAVVLQERCWVEQLASNHAFEDSLELDIRTILDCDFDTTTNAAAFRAEFRAQAYGA